MHGLSEKQFKSKTILDSNDNMRQIKMKLFTIIDQLHDNLPYMAKIANLLKRDAIIHRNSQKITSNLLGKRLH